MSSPFKHWKSWLDTYLLTFLSLFLLIFIPLYPKLPLFEAIPGYLVRVRLEDILVLITGAVWLIQALRGKVHWKNPFWGFIALYAVIGLISILSGIFLLQTIPQEFLHISKSGLHFIRYLEYFSLLFFMFSSICSLKHLKIALGLLTFSVLAATIYGIGQLYWQWPVYSTMNREFSKGEALTLTADARLNSTFGGHYDLAAYLVIVLPIIWAMIWHHPRTWVKVCLFGALVSGTWLLIASGSKTALLAWMLGMFATTLLCLYRYKKVFWLVVTTSCVGLLVLLAVIGYVWFNPHNTWLVSQVRQWQKHSLIESLTPAQSILQKIETVLVRRTQTETTPFDLTGQATVLSLPTVQSDGSTTYILVEKEESWSANAIKYGLSMGIRLDTLWPQALSGYAKNFLLGSGYGTLNKTSKGAFVEADSTDNNLLRTLGETGILGWVVFYGLIAWLLRRLLLGLKDQNWVTQSYTLGLFGGTLGLLANAMIIDVFAASKVAFTFWALAGLSAKSQHLTQTKVVGNLDEAFTKKVTHLWQTLWPLLVGLLLLFTFLHRNPLFSSSRILSFSDNPWATQALTTAGCGAQLQLWTICRDTTQLNSSSSFLYTQMLSVWLQVFPGIGTYYYLHLGLIVISLILFYFIAQRVLSTSTSVFISLLIYVLFLFVSHIPLTPIDVNLTLPLILLTTLAVSQRLARQKIRWLGIGLAFGLLAASTFSSLRLFDVIYLALPFLVLAACWAVAHFWRKQVRLRPVFSFLAVVTLMLVFIWQGISTRAIEVVAEYRGVSDSLRMTAIQTTNNYFTTWATQLQSDIQPAYLLTTDNPYLWDFYRNSAYELLPLSSKQPFFSQAKQVWGMHDYSSIPAMVTQALNQGWGIFVSEFGLTSKVGQPEWQQLFEMFNLNLVTMGCNEACNVYQITNQPITFINSLSFNQKLLPAMTNETVNFTVMGHRWHTKDPELTHEPAQLLPILQTVHAGEPDFSLISGNVFKGYDENQEEVFMKWWGNQPSFPFFLLPGNYDQLPHPQAGTHLQSFALDHSLFILLDFNEKGEVPLEQQLTFYNLLLDVKRSPAIKNLFIFTHKLEWLADSQGYENLALLTTHPSPSTQSSFYQNNVLPKLAELIDTNVFVVSGDLKPLDKPAVLYHHDTVHDITYLATGSNHHSSDTFLSFSVSPHGQVSVEARSINSEPLQAIETYNLDFWREEAPGVEQPGIQTKPQFKMPAWLLQVLVALTLGVGCSQLARYQFQIHKHSHRVLNDLTKVRNRLLQTIRK